MLAWHLVEHLNTCSTKYNIYYLLAIVSGRWPIFRKEYTIFSVGTPEDELTIRNDRQVNSKYCTQQFEVCSVFITSIKIIEYIFIN